MSGSSYAILGGFFGIVALVLLVVAIGRLRGELRVTAALAVVLALLVIEGTWGYVHFAGYPPRWLAVAAAAVLGLVLGRWAGRRAALRVEPDVKGKPRVLGRPAPGYLVIWTAGLLVAWAAALAGYQGVRALGVLTMFIGAGMALSTNIVLLGRCRQLRKQTASGSLAQ